MLKARERILEASLLVLEYANSCSIPFVLFVGENELKEKKFKLKDMVCGEEKTRPLEEIIKELKKE